MPVALERRSRHSRSRTDGWLEATAAGDARPAPVWLVWAHDSAESHTAYRGARRTLCGFVVLRARRGRSGQAGAAECIVCRRAAARLTAAGLVGDPEERGACLGVTRKGLPCQRDPGADGYCPSHAKLGRP